MNPTEPESHLAPLERLANMLVKALPTVALVLALLVGGLVVALLVRRFLRFVVQRTGLEAAAERAGVAKLLYGVGLRHGLAQAVGNLGLVGVLLLTASAVSDVLGIRVLAQATGALVGVLPRLVLAVTVLGAALFVAGVLKRLTAGLRSGDEEGGASALAEILYYAVVTIGVVLAADQAGINTDLVSSLLKIGAAAGGAGAALAIALGGRSTFEHLIARHYGERMLQRGERVRVGAVEGVVLRAGATAVVLRTSQGEALVPWRQVLDQGAQVLDTTASDER